MTEKVYITSKQTATFICPKCQNSKTIDVSKYADLDKLIKINVKCSCGHKYISLLEKRRQYRKETNLPGSYVRIVDGKMIGGGIMTVRDLSTSGMKLHINGDHPCIVGDLLQVKFYLDDPQRNLIQKKVIIRNIIGPKIGTELSATEVVDKALGFYLFS